MKRLKIGEVVELKSGSHPMTVGADDPKNKLKVICTWAVNGIIKEKSFFKDQLKTAISEDLQHIREILEGAKRIN